MGIELGCGFIEEFGRDFHVFDADRLDHTVRGDGVLGGDVKTRLGGGALDADRSIVKRLCGPFRRALPAAAKERAALHVFFRDAIDVTGDGHLVEHFHSGGQCHVHHGVGHIDVFGHHAHALVADVAGVGGHINHIEAVDVGHHRPPTRDADGGANQRLALGVVQLTADLAHSGVVRLRLQPVVGCGCGGGGRAALPLVVGMQEPGRQVGLRPVAVGRTGRDTQVYTLPSFAGLLVDQGDAFELERVGYALHAGVVGGIPACLLHPVAKADGSAGLGLGFGVDEQFEVGLCAQRWQGTHGQIECGEFGLHVANALVDGLSLLQQFDAACAHEFGGLHQPGEVHPAVLYAVLRVRGEQLFFFVEDGVPVLFLLHEVVQVVALFLQPLALRLTLGAAQGVGMVPVGDGQDGEIACAGDAHLAGIDGGGQVGKDERRRPVGDDRGGGALDLGALSVYRHVVYGVADFLFVVFFCLGGGEDEHHCEEGEEGAWEHGLGF